MNPKCDYSRGSIPDPDEGAYSALRPLVEFEGPLCSREETRKEREEKN